jgi:hypothetical protein
VADREYEMESWVISLWDEMRMTWLGHIWLEREREGLEGYMSNKNYV